MNIVISQTPPSEEQVEAERSRLSELCASLEQKEERAGFWYSLYQITNITILLIVLAYYGRKDFAMPILTIQSIVATTGASLLGICVACKSARKLFAECSLLFGLLGSVLGMVPYLMIPGYLVFSIPFPDIHTNPTLAFMIFGTIELIATVWVVSLVEQLDKQGKEAQRSLDQLDHINPAQECVAVLELSKSDPACERYISEVFRSGRLLIRCEIEALEHEQSQLEARAELEKNQDACKELRELAFCPNGNA